jgi:hypothetical protein
LDHLGIIFYEKYGPFDHLSIIFFGKNMNSQRSAAMPGLQLLEMSRKDLKDKKKREKSQLNCTSLCHMILATTSYSHAPPRRLHDQIENSS